MSVGLRKSRTARNNLAVEFPNLAKQWHPFLNGSLKPSDFALGSNKKVWWFCENGKDHVWKAVVYTRTRLKAGCPFCAGKKASESNNIAAKFPDLAKQWHPTRNGDLKPNTVTPGSHQLIWWMCPAAEDHVWQKTPNARTQPSGRNCPYCAGYKVCASNCLAATHPSLLAEWDFESNSNLKPSDVVWGSHKRVWWKCRLCSHIWKAAIKDRAYGTGCVFCKPRSFGEDMIDLFLSERDIDFVREYRLEGCRDRRLLPFDFALMRDGSVIGLIEFNGLHHYRAVEKWGGEKYLEVVKKHDAIKWTYCERIGIPLLVIPYWKKSALNSCLNRFLEDVAARYLSMISG